jgi:hypothetical protein
MSMITNVKKKINGVGIIKLININYFYESDRSTFNVVWKDQEGFNNSKKIMKINNNNLPSLPSGYI